MKIFIFINLAQLLGFLADYFFVWHIKWHFLILPSFLYLHELINFLYVFNSEKYFLNTFFIHWYWVIKCWNY